MSTHLTDARGKRMTLPPCLAPFRSVLAKTATQCRARQRHEQREGERLAPLWRRLKRRGDWDELMTVGDALNSVGSFNARFFYQEAARLKGHG